MRLLTLVCGGLRPISGLCFFPVMKYANPPNYLGSQKKYPHQHITRSSLRAVRRTADRRKTMFIRALISNIAIDPDIRTDHMT